ncbi:hypothetical protein DA89_3351 [Vibrio paracholerae]|nr:hypothetical protein DA89_3351 [Vibrio paracholerae]
MVGNNGFWKSELPLEYTEPESLLICLILAVVVENIERADRLALREV